MKKNKRLEKVFNNRYGQPNLSNNNIYEIHYISVEAQNVKMIEIRNKLKKWDEEKSKIKKFIKDNI
ncbi:MAG: hypothetical protein WCI53_06865 [Bacteroidota bacterium]